MYKYTIAREIAAKRVITNRGEELGKLSDLLINERTGEIEKLVIEIDKNSKIVKRLRSTEPIIEVPYAAVTAVSDVFIVDEREVVST
ncbi:MAG: PRC-barrel domain-containing protein [Candidatus Diapherotrites archaeon]|nr:PRC-barrel domain-containing protein [Candidatus Diapherotrites archaeon]